MIVFPFEKVTDVPIGKGGNAEIAASNDLIEVMHRFNFQTLRATNKSYFRGISGYLLDAQILIGFGKDYRVSEVEIRHPFSCLNGEGIYWRNLNLINATLSHKKPNSQVMGCTGCFTLQVRLGLFLQHGEVAWQRTILMS